MDKNSNDSRQLGKQKKGAIYSDPQTTVVV